MKRSILFSLAFLLFQSNSLLGQNLSTKDSISVFYSDLFDKLESKYLNRMNVHWDEAKAYALKEAMKANSFEESLNTTSLVFDTLKCNHCKLFSENAFYGSTLNKPLSQDDFSYEFLLEYQKQTPFYVKLIGENIGYVNIPGMLLIDLTQDSLNYETQRMYDEIAQLAKKKIVKAWIIDLRFNTGGNVYPMLASLHHLLGDNVMYKGLDANGEVTKTHRLKDGGFYSGEKLETKVMTSVEPDVEIPVALIMGKMTGSSGEDIAVAFKHRKNTIFVGEETYGFLTGNDLFELPYNNKIALTVSYIVDDNENYRAYITPDKMVSKEDNFDDLMKDGNVLQAVKFFKTQKK